MGVDLDNPMEYVEHLAAAFNICTFDEFLFYPWIRFMNGLGKEAGLPLSNILQNIKYIKFYLVGTRAEAIDIIQQRVKDSEERPVDFSAYNLVGLGLMVLQSHAGEDHFEKYLDISASGVGSPSNYERGELLVMRVRETPELRPFYNIWRKLGTGGEGKLRENLRQAHLIIVLDRELAILLRESLIEYNDKIFTFYNVFGMNWNEFLTMPVAIPEKIYPPHLRLRPPTLSDPLTFVVQVACKLCTAFLDQRMLWHLVERVRAKRAQNLTNLSAWIGPEIRPIQSPNSFP
jgi:hypothetical protein